MLRRLSWQHQKRALLHVVLKQCLCLEVDKAAVCLPLTVQVSLGGMARTLSPVWMKPASIFPVTQNPDPWSENSEAA